MAVNFLDLFQGFYFWLYYVVDPFEALDFACLTILVLIYHVHKSGFLGFAGNQCSFNSSSVKVLSVPAVFLRV